MGVREGSAIERENKIYNNLLVIFGLFTPILTAVIGPIAGATSAILYLLSWWKTHKLDQEKTYTSEWWNETRKRRKRRTVMSMEQWLSSSTSGEDSDDTRDQKEAIEYRKREIEELKIAESILCPRYLTLAQLSEVIADYPQSED